MSVESTCGPCCMGDHDRCQDGTVPGLIGGWYCGCKHTAAEDEARAAAVRDFLAVPTPSTPEEAKT